MKILMISDYDIPIGGIEQYICDAAQLLSADKSVSVIWLKLDSHVLHRIRSFLLPITAFNIYITCKIVFYIIKNKPDLIWRNSVSRYIGWLPIWVVWLFHIRTWMMYHDLWYFHPYPSLLTDVAQIPLQWTLSWWLTAGYSLHRTWLIHRIMMLLKFLSVSAIRTSLIRNVSLHLVPSSYMIPILQQWWIEEKKNPHTWTFWKS